MSASQSVDVWPHTNGEAQQSQPAAAPPDGSSSSNSSSNDVFEEMDDVSDLLAKPLEQNPAYYSPLQPLPSHGVRNLPASFVKAGFVKPPKSSQNTLPSPSPSKNGIVHPPAESKVVPSSPVTKTPQHDSLIIGGSGARVPTQFLDSSGSFAKRESHQPGSNSSTVSQGAHTNNLGTQTEVKPFASSARRPRSVIDRAAIDLTVSDDEDDAPVEMIANPLKPEIIKVDEDDEDEPVIVSHTKSEVPTMNEIICAGLIHATVLCIHGLPPSLWYSGVYEDAPPDPAYTKLLWPNVTHFWSEKNYRPVTLTLTNPPPVMPEASSSLPGGWNYYGPNTPAQQIDVSALLAPTVAHPTIARAEAIAKGHVVGPSFGSLAEKYTRAMEPLLTKNKIRLEARCRMRPEARARGFIHNVEILVFTRRTDVYLVSDILENHGIQLDYVPDYHPEDYPTAPVYDNPHNPPPGGFKHEVPNAYSGIYRGSGFGTAVRDKEMTEEERKQQVDTIYASIKSGEELAAVEPMPIVTTRLMPHQKQALGFLLERERARTWSELLKPKSKANDTDPKSSSPSANVASGNGQINGSSKGAARAAAEADKDDNISLWKARAGLNGTIRHWTNIITRRETVVQPRICRGSILADDMGLGKTITTIALIAHTLDEAKAFGSAPVQKDIAIERAHEIEAPVETAKPKLKSPAAKSVKEDSDYESEEKPSMSIAIHGAPPLAPRFRAPPVPEPSGKKKPKVDLDVMRRKHIQRRSRATLIICPLSVVSNWEDQFREHWDKKKKLSIYLYHGTNRITDTKRLANFDIVVTTYQTLGHEFSRQKLWIPEDGGKSDKKSPYGDDDDDDEDPILMYDEFGNVIEDAGALANGKKRKRAPAKESPNTLQKIEWFRVVLDEAHYIKGAATWQSKAVCNLSSQRRLCLTGTPIQNSIDDLFALMRFLRLDPFTDRATWNEFCGHRENIGLRVKAKENDPIDTANMGHVQIVMKYLALRRQKTSKTADGKDLLTLPPKYSKTQYLEFNEMEKARYQALHSQYKDEFEEMVAKGTVNSNYATILHEILILRMTCDHIALVDASMDAKRKAAGGDLSRAIEQDGLSRERAALLFTLFRESEMATCHECQRDLGGGGGELKAKREVDDFGFNDEDFGHIKGKGKVAKSSTASTPRTGMASGAETPSDFGRIEPVVTRCQHLFCAPCFSRLIDCPWPSLLASEHANCPACSQSLQLIIDAVQLEASDLAELVPEVAAHMSDDDDAGPRRIKGKNSDAFDWGSDEDSKADLPPRARSTRNGKAAVKGEPSDVVIDRDVVGALLETRKDMSTKIRALIADLIPFSECNPHSALFDPTAPQLLHVDVSKSEDPEIKASEEPVVVTQRPPVSVKSEMLSRLDSADAYTPIKSVVFSQWTKMLDRIQKSLKITGIRCTRLDGSMRRVDRSAALEKFRDDPGTEVLLVSLRAGGTGLNLVSACRAYLMDPYWNPAVENQGLDRIHRMGQTQPVITTKYIMNHSIEENMLRLQKRKLMLAETAGGRRIPSGAAGAQARKEERRKELSILFGSSGDGVDDL